MSVYATFRELDRFASSKNGYNFPVRHFCSVLLTAIWIRNGIFSLRAWYDHQHGGAPVRIS